MGRELKTRHKPCPGIPLPEGRVLYFLGLPTPHNMETKSPLVTAAENRSWLVF